MSDIKSISLDKFKSLIEINTRINLSYGDSRALLASILESVMCMVQCEAASLLLVNREDGRLHFSIALGPKGAEVKKIKVDKNSIAGWVAQNKQSVVINDVGSDPRFNSSVQDKTDYISKNMIAFPMCVGDECVGVIELINKASDIPFNDDDLMILELLGKQAAIAYENARKYRSNMFEIDALHNAMNAGRDYHTFIVKSPAVLSILDNIDEASSTNSSVLIIGESGVGKELFAEQVHLRSLRRDKPFVRVSCAALSPALLESELFGHVKGAYTDAVSDVKGRFETADGGTIFLDEIGELPLALQSKLLRVIQERKFERVGSSRTVSVDVRIIAATNRNLEDMVHSGTFRNDLYFRLNVLTLNVPPLRERKEEIEPLCALFLDKFKKETHKNFEGFSESALSAIYSYSWPGNIRELENTVERACIIGRPPFIQVGDLRLPVKKTESGIQGEIQNCVSEIASSEDVSLKNALNAFKKKYVLKILEENGWNQTAAAKALGIQRTYVSKLISELGIRN